VLIELPTWLVIGLNVAGWPVIQLALAWLFIRMPEQWFHPGEGFSWERTGRFYEGTFGIKRWKDRLPDAARWFEGGFAKGALTRRDSGYLERFIRETWRGELCHWCALCLAPVFALWNPPWAVAVMLGCGVLLNLPCILAQRYNRLRLRRLVNRK